MHGKSHRLADGGWFRDGVSYVDLVVLSVHFEVALRVGADRADLRCLSADHDVSAVAAFPNLDFTLFEDFLHLDVLQKGSVALFVLSSTSVYRFAVVATLDLLK